MMIIMHNFQALDWYEALLSTNTGESGGYIPGHRLSYTNKLTEGGGLHHLSEEQIPQVPVSCFPSHKNMHKS